MSTAITHSSRPAKAARRSRALLLGLAASIAGTSLLAAAGPAAATTPFSAYVSSWAGNTVSSIDTSTNTVASAIPAGAAPAGKAITPDGKTAYVANYGAASVTPIDTATSTAGSPIAVGSSPTGIAITPDGTTAYVTNSGSDTVTPISLATNSAGTPIAIGGRPVAVAISPDGKTAYVVSSDADRVTPIALDTNTAGTPITVGDAPQGIAIAPDGTSAYVTNSRSNTVTPISLTTNTAGTPIAVGSTPMGIAVTPDGTSAYVANLGVDTVTPITLATNTPRTPITVGNGPIGIAITPDGKTAYVVNSGYVAFTGDTTSGSTSVSGIPSTARLTQGMTVSGPVVASGTTVAAPPGSSSITLSQPATATAAGVALTAWAPGNVQPIDLATQTAGAAISLASFDFQPAVSPDQAPVASFTVTPGETGAPSYFDASASTVAHGTIASYAWDFGDGSTAVTSTPTTAHVYAAAGTYSVALTETDSAGTSTSQVFTGQTMSRNGGPSAQATRTVLVASAPQPTATPPKPLPVVIAAKVVTLTARGTALIPVGCPANSPDACRGTLTIRLAGKSHTARAVAARCARGCRPLGTAKYEARAGKRTRVQVQISAYGRRLLARHKTLRVNVTATTRSGGRSATTVRAITLKARNRVA